jgi:hypothetical protein
MKPIEESPLICDWAPGVLKSGGKGTLLGMRDFKEKAYGKREHKNLLLGAL